MSSLATEQWLYRPDWAEYAFKVWQGKGRVEEIKDNSPERLEFMARAEAAFRGRGYPVKRIRTWVNVMPPEEATGYDKGYPHVHFDDTALTLVHYLSVAPDAPPLDVFEGDELVESIQPVNGMTVFIPNGVRHGVRKNNSNLNRIAFIATAYSK